MAARVTRGVSRPTGGQITKALMKKTKRLKPMTNHCREVIGGIGVRAWQAAKITVGIRMMLIAVNSSELMRGLKRFASQTTVMARDPRPIPHRSHRLHTLGGLGVFGFTGVAESLALHQRSTVTRTTVKINICPNVIGSVPI
jgi:hypothetical protein